MPKTLSSSAPRDYAACIHTGCPMAATCLRHTAYREHMAQQATLSIVNPTQCTADATCTHYRDSQPVRFARGFTSFQDRMYPAQYARFARTLQARFSRNPYYERRRGDYAMPPAEQQFVLQTLASTGIKASWPFDSYEYAVNWYE